MHTFCVCRAYEDQCTENQIALFNILTLQTNFEYLTIISTGRIMSTEMKMQIDLFCTHLL